MCKTSINLSSDYRKYLSDIGKGNISRGIRLCTDFHRDRHEFMQEIKSMLYVKSTEVNNEVKSKIMSIIE